MDSSPINVLFPGNGRRRSIAAGGNFPGGINRQKRDGHGGEGEGKGEFLVV